MVFSFGGFELDDALFELRSSGAAVALEPRAFDVLSLLLLHRDRVVTKTELLSVVWEGVEVTEAVVPRAVAAIRKALGDDARASTFVQTVHGRGYRFVAPVEVAGAPTAKASLEQLSDECRRVLQAASVLRHPFGLAALSEMTGVDSTRLAGLLEEAIEAGILRRDDRWFRCSFVEPAFREHVESRLSLATRLELHRLAAETLIRAHGPEDPALGAEIAEHLYRAAAGEADARGAALCRGVSERELARQLYRESAHWRRRELELTSSEDALDRCRAWAALAETLALVGEGEAALEAAQAGARLARDLGERELLARAALGCRWDAASTSLAAEGVTELLEEGLAATTERQAGLRARLLAELARTPRYAAPLDRQRELAQQALELARSSGESAALRDAFHLALWSLVGPEGVRSRLEVAEEALALAMDNGDRLTALHAHEAGLIGSLLLGEHDEAQRCLGAFGRAARELGLPVLDFRCLVMQCGWALTHGDLESAQRLLERAEAQANRSAERLHFITAGLRFHLDLGLGDRGSVAENDVFFGEMLDLPFNWRMAVRSARALSCAVAGDLAGARQALQYWSPKVIEQLPHDEHWLSTLASLSHAVVLVDEEALARALYQSLEPFRELLVVHDFLFVVTGSVEGALAALAALLNRREDALGHYRRALERERQMRLVIPASSSRRMVALLEGEAPDPGDATMAGAPAGHPLRRVVDTLESRLGLA